MTERKEDKREVGGNESLMEVFALPTLKTVIMRSNIF
jgi:hypothetical protein